MTQLKIFAALLAAATLASAPSCARAATIFESGTYGPTGTAFSSNDTSTGQKIATTFSIDFPEPTTVKSLRIIGGYVARIPPPFEPPLDSLPVDSFHVAFLSDTGGSPGPPLPNGLFLPGSPIRRTPFGGPLLNGITSPFSFVLDLGEGVAVFPHTRYWVSVSNNPGPDFGWVWARTSDVVQELTTATFGPTEVGPWAVPERGGMILQLWNERIPEPSSLVSASVALCVTMLRRSAR